MGVTNETAELRKKFKELWIRRRKAWESKFLVGSCLPKDFVYPTAASEKMAKQSWVLGTKKGCGCLPCNKANTMSEWALGTAGLVDKFRAWYLTKHQESQQHVAACKKFLGISESYECGPSLSEFEDLFKKLQQGSSLRGDMSQKLLSDISMILSVDKF